MIRMAQVKVTSTQIRSEPGILRQIWSARWAYFFIAPIAIIFLLFGLGPVLYGFFISLQDVKFGSPSFFVGLKNYVDALKDPYTWNALRVTLIFVVVLVPIATAVHLFLSVLIFRLPERAQTFYKAAFYLPAVISAVILTMIWWWIFNPTYGLANYVLTLVGAGTVPWISRPGPAIIAIIIMSVAGGGGGTIVLYTAALGGIPRHLYESADIDGARGWDRFWNITLPLLKPTTLYLLVTGTVGTFQIFTQVFLFTQGGPARTTETVAMLVYDTAFLGLRLGPAAATSILLFGVIALVAVFLFRTFSTDVEY